MEPADDPAEDPAGILAAASALGRAVEHLAFVGRPGWSSVGEDALALVPERTEAAARTLHAVACSIAAERARGDETRGQSTGSAAARPAAALGVPTGEARRRIEAGRREGTEGMGAHAAGRIAAAQESTIARWAAELPHSTPAEVASAFARFLTGLAECGVGVRRIGTEAERALVEIDPHRQERTAEIQSRRRAARLSPPAVDGTSHIGLTCTPELRAVIDAVVTRFAAPGWRLAATAEPHTGETPDRDVLAESDTRSPGQRAHDALRHVLELGLAATPARGRGVASIVVRLSPEQLDALDSGGGMVTTDSGTDLSARQAVAMATERSWFVSALRDGHEELHRVDVDAAPRRRLAGTLQRLVLYAAHGGCTHPGCACPASACQVHHVRDHAGGGPTALWNLTLACPVHHGWVGRNPRQWRTVVDPAAPGRPTWLPPAGPEPGRDDHDEGRAGHRSGSRSRHRRRAGRAAAAPHVDSTRSAPAA